MKTDLELWDIFLKDGSGIYVKVPDGFAELFSREVIPDIAPVMVRKITIEDVADFRDEQLSDMVIVYNDLCEHFKPRPWLD